MTPAKLLVVDANAICYSAYYSCGRLSYDKQKTGIIYGFFWQIQHICRSQRITRLAFCWDSRQSHRKRIFPAYKSNRNKKDADLLACRSQFHELRKEIIPALGFANNFHFIGYEADDLIASLCNFPGPDPGQEYVIASNDQDLYQLLSDRIHMYRLSKKLLYTAKDFAQQYGIAPQLWPEVKALAGCRSDTVPGIPGIGECRALAYLKESAHEKNVIIDTPVGRAILERNRKLVNLPFQGTPKMVLDWQRLPSYAEWLSLCEKYGFLSFLRNSDIWESIFSGTPIGNGLERIKIGRKK